MKKILSLLKPYTGTLLLSILFSLINTGMQLALPLLNKQINTAILTSDWDGPQGIRSTAFIMLGFTVAAVITSISNTYFSTRTSVNYSIALRNYVFRKVSSLSQSNIDEIGVASLVTRTTNDIRQIHDIVLNVLKSLLPIPVMITVGLVMIFRIYPEVAKQSLSIIPVLLALALILIAIIVPLYTRVQKLLDKINQLMREKIGGIRVIRAFNKTEYENERFYETNNKLTGMALRAGRLLSGLIPILTLLLYGFIVMIMITITKTVNKLDPSTQFEEIIATIPTLSMFVSFFGLLIQAIISVVSIIVAIPRASISGKRVRAILEAEPDVKDPEVPVEPDPAQRGVVEFRNVSFRYKPRKPKDEKKKRFGRKKEEKKPEGTPFGLENISFISRPGEVTAIIGVTGSGKSTLLNLIPRLYDVTEGQILVGGVDVRDQTGDKLHESIAVIPQQAFLFSGTIADNVRYGKPDATDEEVWRALEIAQAKSFVSAMPEAEESPVSQAGKNFSGGQKQRLAIARAIVKGAPIMLFDDSFSALDLATDARLRASLKENVKDTNIIIVAQRVGTVLGADRILVMDGGRIVGQGTHRELLDSCEIYREIVLSQLGKEELNGGGEENDG